MGRDVRTVMRWEKERDLPIHRGPDGKAGLVFADTHELDAWTRGEEAVPEAIMPPAVLSDPVARAVTRRWTVAAMMAILALALGIGEWRSLGSQGNEGPESVVMTEDAITARNAEGSEKWRYEFAGEMSTPPFSRATQPIEWLGAEGIIAGTSYTTRRKTQGVHSGQVLWLDRAGKLKQSFSFEDRLTIGGREYSAPWVVSDYQLDGGHGPRLIAVLAHHFEWWPSIVTILDDQWRRKGSFVNAGWVEHVRWLPEHRLAITGFSNVKDGGMVALLDRDAMNGQAPAPRNSEFECASCGPDRPLRYVVMPRSEVNRASASPFNRASVSVHGDALLVRTVEQPGSMTTAAADAIYEFTQQLDLVQASYSDRYWDMHRELERLGKITHTRQQCPDRDGPRQIEVWDPATGWSVQTVRRRATSPR